MKLLPLWIFKELQVWHNSNFKHSLTFKYFNIFTCYWNKCSIKFPIFLGDFLWKCWGYSYICLGCRYSRKVGLKKGTILIASIKNLLMYYSNHWHDCRGSWYYCNFCYNYYCFPGSSICYNSNSVICFLLRYSVSSFKTFFSW